MRPLTLIVSFFIMGFNITNHQTQFPEMVQIDSGVFRPLFKDSQGRDSIFVKAFLMDTVPVSNEDYKIFTLKHPKWNKTNIKSLFSDSNYLKHWDKSENYDKKLNKSPVVNISWFSARAYCRSHGKRLPNSNEWEYAAAAGLKHQSSKDEPNFKNILLRWYSDPTPQQLPNVGIRKNYWGLYDLHGLIWEWVNDFNNVLVTGESRGDSGLERNLFCGSGSVGSVDPSDYAAFMRYGFRSSLKANYTVSNLGFRCALEVSND